MAKKILLIIMCILIVLGIIGSVCFITFKNDIEAKSENVNETITIPENLINSNINDENIVSNEVENNTSNSSTKASSSSSNNDSKTKENVNKSTNTSTTTTKSPSSSTSQSSNSQSNKKEESKTEQKEDKCTNNSNHFIGVGNSDKWFNTKNDAIEFYNQKIKYWGEKWENFEIDNDTYYKNCPSGYEVWDCAYCGKWTINFYYR